MFIPLSAIFWWLAVGAVAVILARLLITHGSLKEHFNSTFIACYQLQAEISRMWIRKLHIVLQTLLVLFIALTWCASGPFLIPYVLTDIIKWWIRWRKASKEQVQHAEAKSNPPAEPVKPAAGAGKDIRLHVEDPHTERVPISASQAPVPRPPAAGTPGSPA